MTHFNKFCAAQVDPFSQGVKGAKIPDSYSFPTQTAQLEAEFIIVPDDNGNFDFAVLILGYPSRGIAAICLARPAGMTFSEVLIRRL